jgi:hypothetical protein
MEKHLNRVRHPIVVLDSAGGMCHANNAWTEFAASWIGDEALGALARGAPYADLLCRLPADSELRHVAAELELVVMGRTDASREICLGSGRDARWFCVLFRYVDNGSILVMHQDITAMRLAQRRATLAYELCAAVIGRDGSAYWNFIDAIRRTTGCPLIVVWSVDRDEGCLRLSSAIPPVSSASSRSLQRPLSDAAPDLAQTALARGQCSVPELGEHDRELLGFLAPHVDPSGGLAIACDEPESSVVVLYGIDQWPGWDQECEQLVVSMFRSEPAARASGTTNKRPSIAPGGAGNLSRLAADCDESVLILGESGVGKTRLARWIHEHSARASKPFLDLNCAGLAPALLESELFGHERGAFTGADRSKPGLLEVARGGTILLDEIAELDLQVQAKLLKALETHAGRRVGGTREFAVDVRYMAATNRDLWALVEQGRFREDLLYRLDVIQLRLPPLRERPEQLRAIAHEIVAEIAQNRRQAIQLRADAMTELLACDWPGNVRQLRNTLQRATLLSDGVLEATSVRAALGETSREVARQPGVLALKGSERDHIVRVLALTGYNVRRTAALLKISRSTLYEKMRRYEIDTSAGREERRSLTPIRIGDRTG